MNWDYLLHPRGFYAFEYSGQSSMDLPYFIRPNNPLPNASTINIRPKPPTKQE
ncbi:hypothetical protein AG1IA_03105 [Rhizoctonia solani AG-1 IA]|uniref:Uncharacterized protein n=1 Tax=Thanatephorus cucumeris (strain AG1-IA) TaxID=983506 RepID=L8X1K0_THACA|nr:hypothetical protein AG1IA_03105 [Rhizoctonia solani AG-1 IA]